MMDIEYQIAWGVYLGAGLIFFSLGCWFSQFIVSGVLRGLFRATLFFLIFLPWNLPGEVAYYAPASLVVVLEFFIGSADKIGGALVALALSIGGAAFFFVIRGIFKR
tara:strand:+ start:139 stop:459 length:321 start_codon:yes stop_codon:yes gene_type:complete